ncbi:phosphopentomutase [Eubacteriales bacterium OttesenSCG-928-A19]|nr:phosphopentomutase [Eubacteriales bacterium OttesenSCG-928-A19]
MTNKKAILIVLDGVGAGAAPDADAYGDVGANTLRHVAEAGHPDLPNLRALGLGNLPDSGLAPAETLMGAYGRCQEQSAGKDTTTGHWEMAGLITRTPFPVFPDGFPPEVMQPFEAAIGRGTLGNYASSGTEILDVLGEEHMRTGKPIVYTSADSVFQIAAHEEVIPHEELWRICEIARGILTGPYAVGRVIARPFVGTPGAFVRTGNRRDFSVVPPSDTLLDVLSRNGYDVAGVGKIEDIFAHRGLTLSDHAAGNDACLASTLKMLELELNGMLFVNLVDFDSVYGHRNDIDGFARALEAVDRAVPAILERMGPDDVLIFTADHGCDPGFPGTDHTREFVPLLCYQKGLIPVDLGIRSPYGDIAATILEMFDLPNTLSGTSFLSELKKEA